MINNRDFETNETILSGDLLQNDNDGANIGDNSYQVVSASNLSDATEINGFTITGGNANGSSPLNKGGGMYLITSNIKAANLIITANKAGSNGGGIYVGDGSFPVFNNLTIYENSSNAGGGIQFWNSSSVISNSYIYNNHVSSMGGGIYNYITYQAPADTASGTTIINTTIAQNSTTDIMYGGAGIYNWCYDNNLSLINCLLYDNIADPSVFTNRNLENFSSDAYPTISYSLIGGSGGSGAAWNAQTGTDGGNNLDEDPLFVESDKGNFSLFTGSGAIGTGNTSYGTNMGAYQGSGAAFPSLSITESLTGFGEIEVGQSSEEQSFTVEGNDLINSLQIFAPEGFELSLASGDYSGETSIVELSPSDGQLPETTIYVRFTPVSDVVYATILSLSSEYISETIAISGTGTPPPPPPTTAWYVRNDASGDSTGLSWEHAFTSINEAVSAADAGDTVFVAQGQYTGGVYDFTSNIYLYGSLAGDETNINAVTLQNRDLINNATILNGDTNGDDGENFENMEDNGGNLISLYDVESIVIDGFTIVNGYQDQWGIQNDDGAGILLRQADSVIIRNCVLRHNKAVNQGGGIAVKVSYGVVLENILFYHNYSNNSGGGLFSSNSTIKLINTTFTENISYNTTGAAIGNSSSSSLEVINTIIYNNQSSTFYGTPYDVYNNGGELSFGHSLIERSGGSTAWDEEFGTDNGNNIEELAWFVNAGERDFRILDISPAAGTGNPAYGPNMGYYQGEPIETTSAIVISENSLQFDTLNLFHASEEQSFLLYGADLSNDILIQAPDNIQLSLRSGDFGAQANSLTLKEVEGTVTSLEIFVRYVPLNAGNFSGTISITSGLDSESIACTGTCIVPTEKTIIREGNGYLGDRIVGLQTETISFMVAGLNLDAALEVFVYDGNCELSLTGDFSDAETPIWINPVGGSVQPTTIYTRYTPVNEGNIYVSIRVRSGSDTEFFSLSGKGILPEDPTLVAVPNALSFEDLYSGEISQIQMSTISGFNLSEDVGLTAPEGFEISLVHNDISGNTESINLSLTGGNLASTQVFVRFAPQTPGNYNGTLAVNSGVYSAPIALSAECIEIVEPELNVSVSSLEFGDIALGQTSDTQMITFYGTNLEGDVMLQLSAGFEASFTTEFESAFTEYLIEVEGSELPATNIYLRFRPESVMSYEGTLHISSSDINAGIELSGTGSIPTDPYLSISESLLDFSDTETGQSSTEQFFTLEGYQLADDLMIMAPAGFELSLAANDFTGETSQLSLQPEDGVLSETAVYVRFSPTEVQTYDAYISIVSDPFDETMRVTGTGTEEGTNSLTKESGSELNAFPNPTRNNLTLQLNSAALDGGILNIFSADGQFIRKEILAPGATVFHCDLSDLNTGLYIINAYIDKCDYQLRIMKVE